MARKTKTVRWYEVGFWTTDADGRNVTWHTVAAYETAAHAQEDEANVGRAFPDRTLLTRHKRVEVITAL